MGVVYTNSNSKDLDIKVNNNKIITKDGLNTTIANLNKTLDDKIIQDFDKPASNEIGPVNIIPEENHKYHKDDKKRNNTVDENINYKIKEKQKKNPLFSTQKSKAQLSNDKSDETIEQKYFKEKKIEIQPVNFEENINKDVKLNNNIMQNINDLENNNNLKNSNNNLITPNLVDNPNEKIFINIIDNIPSNNKKI